MDLIGRGVTKWAGTALFPQNRMRPNLTRPNLMRPSQTVRERSVTHTSSLQARMPKAGLESPGAFQCTILRALELPKAYRDVFLLREIQGHGLVEIAAMLGISIDTVLVRLKRARHEIGHGADSGARERG